MWREERQEGGLSGRHEVNKGAEMTNDSGDIEASSLSPSMLSVLPGAARREGPHRIRGPDTLPTPPSRQTCQKIGQT